MALINKLLFVCLYFLIVREVREQRGDPGMGDRDCRERHTPSINFAAESLQELIIWDNVRLEPVLTADIPTGKLILFIE